MNGLMCNCCYVVFFAESWALTLAYPLLFPLQRSPLMRVQRARRCAEQVKHLTQNPIKEKSDEYISWRKL